MTIANLSILDVGCGNGVLAKELRAEGADVTALDVVPYPGWQLDADDVVNFQEGDYQEVGPDLGLFDVVTALDVLEHVDDDVGFAQVLHSNAKPGGTAIVTVPAYQMLWSHHDETNQHRRRYTKKGLTAALELAGFQVDRCGYILFGLIAPVLLRKLTTTRKTEAPVGLCPLNRFALSYFTVEHRLAVSRPDFLPAGTSVIAVCRRPE